MHFIRLFDSDYGKNNSPITEDAMAGHLPWEWSRLTPFFFLHAGCLGVIWTGASPFAVLFALGFYVFRMFAITGFYHRYFSHRTFKTSRMMQFIFAIWGLLAVQRGPLWWAANHRHHHQHSDKPTDLHSPLQRGFWWAHIGWLTNSFSMPTRYERIGDYAKFPELVWLNRFDWFVPLLLFLGMYALGDTLAHVAPQLGTTGWQMVVWGFFISTVLLYHGTSTINSLSHVFGSQRFETGDTSRNNWLLAIITLGEGWHNNHHRYQAAAQQGFYWWEIDMTYYVLRAMAAVGLIWELKPVPASIYAEAANGKLAMAKPTSTPVPTGSAA